MTRNGQTGDMSDDVSPDQFSRGEIGKDATQSAVEAAATAVGELATIITKAVQDVAGALGGFATELFEIQEAARKATDKNTVPSLDEDLGPTSAE